MALWRAIKTLALVGFVAATWIRSGAGAVRCRCRDYARWWGDGGAGSGGQPQALKMCDDVFAQDRISTKERSMVHILMGGKGSSRCVSFRW